MTPEQNPPKWHHVDVVIVLCRLA